jgi:hypothetical protein
MLARLTDRTTTAQRGRIEADPRQIEAAEMVWISAQLFPRTKALSGAGARGISVHTNALREK